MKSHVRRMLRELMPEEVQRNTVMMAYAYSGLTIDNIAKMVAQIQGDGNNGKSTLMQITQIVFSVYSQAMVDKMLDVGTASGEVLVWPVSFHGKRWLWQDESTAKKAMDGCKVKRYSGGTGLCSRIPYGPLINVLPTWKMWFMGNDRGNFKPMDQALSDRFINVQMVSTFTNDPMKRQRALAGPYKDYVCPMDPDLLANFHKPEYKAAWIEICSEYLQMCVEAKATQGTLLPRFESDFVTVNMYMGETPDPSEIFHRLFDVTGNQATGKDADEVTIDNLFPRIKDGRSGNYDKTKEAFKEWIKHHVKNNLTNVKHVSTVAV
jgi:hypothetical protein